MIQWDNGEMMKCGNVKIIYSNHSFIGVPLAHLSNTQTFPIILSFSHSFI